MAHRFAAELTHADGRPASVDATWQATVYAGGADTNGATRIPLLVELDLRESSVSVPSPLGYTLDVSDSIVVVAVVAGDVSGVRLRVTIDYDPVETQGRLLGVRPLRVGAGPAPRVNNDSASDGVPTHTWEWTADVDGRLAAIAGRPLVGARSLVIREAGSGAVIWRATLGSRAGDGAYAASGEVVRPGIPIEAGRAYTLTVTYDGSNSVGVGGCVQAMVLPFTRAAR
jgi:hypothetical protein